jgi:hypothetical protein
VDAAAYDRNDHTGPASTPFTSAYSTCGCTWIDLRGGSHERPVLQGRLCNRPTQK